VDVKTVLYDRRLVPYTESVDDDVILQSVVFL